MRLGRAGIGEQARVVEFDRVNTLPRGDGVLAPVMPAEGFSISGSTPLARDVLADYLSRLGGHLREESLLDGATPRLSVPGALPISCSSR